MDAISRASQIYLVERSLTSVPRATSKSTPLASRAINAELQKPDKSCLRWIISPAASTYYMADLKISSSGIASPTSWPYSIAGSSILEVQPKLDFGVDSLVGGSSVCCVGILAGSMDPRESLEDYLILRSSATGE